MWGLPDHTERSPTAPGGQWGLGMCVRRRRTIQLPQSAVTALHPVGTAFACGSVYPVTCRDFSPDSEVPLASAPMLSRPSMVVLNVSCITLFHKRLCVFDMPSSLPVGICPLSEWAFLAMDMTVYKSVIKMSSWFPLYSLRYVAVVSKYMLLPQNRDFSL